MDSTTSMIVGVILGGIIGWVIARYFYHKNSLEQKVAFTLLQKRFDRLEIGLTKMGYKVDIEGNLIAVLEDVKTEATGKVSLDPPSQ